MKIPDVFLVPPLQAEAFYPLVKQMIGNHVFPRPAMFTLEQAFAFCRVDKMQLWLVHDLGEEPFFFALTERNEYPLGVTVRVCLVGGRGIRRALHRLEVLEAWARMQGAERLELETTPKLARVLVRYGYQPTLLMCHKNMHTMH